MNEEWVVRIPSGNPLYFRGCSEVTAFEWDSWLPSAARYRSEGEANEHIEKIAGVSHIQCYAERIR